MRGSSRRLGPSQRQFPAQQLLLLAHATPRLPAEICRLCPRVPQTPPWFWHDCRLLDCWRPGPSTQRALRSCRSGKAKGHLCPEAHPAARRLCCLRVRGVAGAHGHPAGGEGEGPSRPCSGFSPFSSAVSRGGSRDEGERGSQGRQELSRWGIPAWACETPPPLWVGLGREPPDRCLLRCCLRSGQGFRPPQAGLSRDQWVIQSRGPTFKL